MADMIRLEYTDIFDESKIKEVVFSKHLIKNEVNEKSLFALMVDGKSMQPVINDRAVVVADLSQKKLEDESIYILYHEEKMWIKKYDDNTKSFVSINPEFSHLVYDYDDVHLVAKVLLTFTSL